MHCLNIVRCMIVFLDCINIMRFQKKKLLLLLLTSSNGVRTLIAHVIVYMLSLGLDRIYVVQQSHISINLDVRKHVSSTFIMVFVVLCGLLLLW